MSDPDNKPTLDDMLDVTDIIRQGVMGKIIERQVHYLRKVHEGAKVYGLLDQARAEFDVGVASYVRSGNVDSDRWLRSCIEMTALHLLLTCALLGARMDAIWGVPDVTH